MNKSKKAVGDLFIAVTIVSIVILSFFSVGLVGRAVYVPPSNSSTILYYSETCPHCKNVEGFIEQNDISSKMNIIQKEVKLNESNAKELITVQNYCKIDKNYIGSVPLLYSDGKCYLGDIDIIDFLKTKLGTF